MAAPFNIRIDLDPVTDGIVQGRKIIPFTGDIREDRNDVIIGTNGEMKTITHDEALQIFGRMGDKHRSLFLGDQEYIAFFNPEKTFEVDGSDYLAGSALVMKVDGYDFVPMTEDDIDDAVSYFEERLGIFKAGDLKFAALII